ncbi:MAG TPA: hypothetical protein VM686_32970 [Polyangiaceae bacterium]|jgi:hypothetical protein|nr:hypothetical protein [Polyangiaceae bacterium]
MSYRIVDEPGRSALEQAIVDPKWPFFASMFAGAWLAFPWFVINAFALGGARRYGDLLISGLLLAVNAALIVGTSALLSRMVLTEQSYPYVLLVPVAVRLVAFYVLYLRQAKTFELFEYFGGTPRNGLLLVIAGSFLRGRVLGELPPVFQLLLA